MCRMPGVTWKPKSLPQSDSEINLYAALFVVSCWEGWGLWCYILYFISQLHNLTVSIICKFQSLEAFQSTKPGLKTNFYSSVNLNMNVIRRLSKDHNGWMPWRSISFYTFIYGIVLANFVRITNWAKIKIKQWHFHQQCPCSLFVFVYPPIKIEREHLLKLFWFLSYL